MRPVAHPVVRTLVIATGLGFLILGIGGRIAMAMITADAGGMPSFTVGGTFTVVMLGAVSGLAGGVLALISRASAKRLAPRHDWLQYVLLAVVLGLVTMRGLRGSPPAGRWYFYVLVALYGVALSWLTQSQRPRPLDSE